MLRRGQGTVCRAAELCGNQRLGFRFERSPLRSKARAPSRKPYFYGVGFSPSDNAASAKSRGRTGEPMFT
ncbi:hypothetical protein chiPu_0032467, partial [Chiloscyllium punctatum]|nr:hypothetical protein [Chiloscyllium punctatum]